MIYTYHHLFAQEKLHVESPTNSKREMYEKQHQQNRHPYQYHATSSISPITATTDAATGNAIDVSASASTSTFSIPMIQKSTVASLRRSNMSPERRRQIAAGRADFMEQAPGQYRLSSLIALQSSRARVSKQAATSTAVSTPASISMFSVNPSDQYDKQDDDKSSNRKLELVHGDNTGQHTDSKISGQCNESYNEKDKEKEFSSAPENNMWTKRDSPTALALAIGAAIGHTAEGSGKTYDSTLFAHSDLYDAEDHLLQQ
jgi:hypothetical protein